MAPGKKRSARANGSSTRSASPSDAEGDEITKKSSKANEETCPACTQDQQLQDTEEWAMCGSCKVWYHWRCAGNGEDLNTVDKWFCKTCMEKEPRRTITYKAPTRKSERKKTARDYANIELGIPSDPNRWMNMMEGKPMKEDSFKRMKGGDVGLEWLTEDEDAMTEPILIESPAGLGMKMPEEDFGVEDVALLVGENTPLEVIDVASQSSVNGWTLGKWVEYFNLEPDKREKILNVISLEISGTLLSDRILPPRLVREIDWVENYWPSTKKGKGHSYPKVQLYCLMGVQGAWTDWHIDFAGSSVYYHIMEGSKVFYFIKPTAANLAAYERWSGTDIQNQTWLGDMVDEVIKVTLTESNTMIIPAGWIHAVHTPIDTLVFGGNFLHSYSVPTQLRVRDIEFRTQVPKKFRFPLFTKLCWYVGDKVLKDLKSSGASSFSTRVLTSMVALADFLVSEARNLERGSDSAKKETKDQVPHDRIKDAPAMARELRWRVHHALNGSSEDEGSDSGGSAPRNGVRKRKRALSESTTEPTPPPKFKNFKPKRWDSVTDTALVPRKRTTHAAKPQMEGNEWIQQWSEWKDWEDGVNNGDEPEVDVNVNEQVLIRLRKTANGLQRERIRRVIEEWKWVT